MSCRYPVNSLFMSILPLSAVMSLTYVKTFDVRQKLSVRVTFFDPFLLPELRKALILHPETQTMSSAGYRVIKGKKIKKGLIVISLKRKKKG